MRLGGEEPSGGSPSDESTVLNFAHDESAARLNRAKPPKDTAGCGGVAVAHAILVTWRLFSYESMAHMNP